MRRIEIIACLVLMVRTLALAADWSQWRGPQRNGVAETSPPLATTWPETGPKRIWLSEEETIGGNSSNVQSGSFGITRRWWLTAGSSFRETTSRRVVGAATARCS